MRRVTDTDLQNVLIAQLNSMFRTDYSAKDGTLKRIFDGGYGASLQCIRPYLGNDSNATICPYHSVEYCIFLYWISRLAFLQGDVRFASQVYYLNKIMNSVELFYEVELPNVWSCEHPLGSVMGKASYGEFFYFYQGCTVGGNYSTDGALYYPVIGDHVIMYSHSKIIGNCRIGNNTIISANCYIKCEDIPPNSIVFGESPHLIIKSNNFNYKVLTRMGV